MPFKIKLLFDICIGGIIVCSIAILLLCIITLRSKVLNAYIELMKTTSLIAKTTYPSAFLKEELKELFNTAQKLYNRYKILFGKNKQKDFEKANNKVKNLISIISNLDI